MERRREGGRVLVEMHTKVFGIERHIWPILILFGFSSYREFFSLSILYAIFEPFAIYYDDFFTMYANI